MGASDNQLPPALSAGLRCHATQTASNLAAFGALSVAEAGDVIICATNSSTGTAVTGDLLLGMMKNTEVVAFVTDGFVRNIQGIRIVGLPCFAAGLTPEFASGE